MFSDTVAASPQAQLIANAADSAIAQIRAALGRAKQIAATAGLSIPDSVQNNVIGSLNTLERTLNARVANAARNDVVEGRLDPLKYFAAANELMLGIGRNLEVLGDFSYWSNVKAAWGATLAQLGELGKKVASSAATNLGPWVAGAAVLAFILYFVVPKVIRQRSMAGTKRAKQIAAEEEDEDELDEDEDEDVEDTEFEGDPDDEFNIRLTKSRGLRGLRG